MPRLLEEFGLHLTEGRFVADLADRLGVDPPSVSTAAHVIGPVVLGGILGASNVRDSGDALTDLLRWSPYDDGVKAAEEVDVERPAAGNELLDRLFKAKRGQVMVAAANEVGLETSLVGRVAPFVAPMVLAEVKHLQQRDHLGVAELLRVIEVELGGSLDEAVGAELAPLPEETVGAELAPLPEETVGAELGRSPEKASAVDISEEALPLVSTPPASTPLVSAADLPPLPSDGSGARPVSASAALVPLGQVLDHIDNDLGLVAVPETEPPGHEVGLASQGQGREAETPEFQPRSSLSSMATWLWWGLGAVSVMLMLVLLLSLA